MKNQNPPFPGVTPAPDGSNWPGVTIHDICPYIDSYVAEVEENVGTITAATVYDILCDNAVQPAEMSDLDFDKLLSRLAKQYVGG